MPSTELRALARPGAPAPAPTPRSLLLSLLVAALAAGQENLKPNEIPEHLRLVGDPVEKVTFAEGWAPPPVRRNDLEKVVEAPIWCLDLMKEGRYGEGARLPRAPERVLGRPLADITGWFAAQSGRRPVLLATEHAVLIVDLDTLTRPRTDVSKEQLAWLKAYFPKLRTTVDPVQRAHLYALRYLLLEARFADLLCLLPEREGYAKPAFSGEHLGSKGRGEIVVIKDQDPYREFARHFFGGFGCLSSFWYNREQDGMIMALNGHELKDNELAARFDYQVAQHLTYQYRGYYHKIPVWIAAGLGHYFERLHKDVPDTFFEMGVGKPITWEETNWKAAVKKLVASNEDLNLAQLAQVKDFHELRPPHHAQAWSLVRFALGAGRGRFRRFLDEIKTKGEDESLVEAQFRAIQRAYDIDMLTFHHAWRTWVIKGWR